MEARFFAAADLEPALAFPFLVLGFFAATFSTAAFILLAPVPFAEERPAPDFDGTDFAVVFPAADLLEDADGVLDAVVEPVFRANFFFGLGGAAPSSVALFKAFNS